MPFGNRCGSGALRFFEGALAKQVLMDAEMCGERMSFHLLSKNGGCVEVVLNEISGEHVCEVPLRTLGADEEALCIINNFIKRLKPETQESLVRVLTNHTE